MSDIQENVEENQDSNLDVAASETKIKIKGIDSVINKYR